MEEYIKRENALDAVLFALVGTGLQSKAIYAIRDIPTEDVIPRAEIDKYLKEFKEGMENEKMVDIFLAQRKVAREIVTEIKEKLKAINREIANGKIYVCNDDSIDKFIEEFEKKYIGEKIWQDILI